jgi:hypothetical protein
MLAARGPGAREGQGRLPEKGEQEREEEGRLPEKGEQEREEEGEGGGYMRLFFQEPRRMYRRLRRRRRP